jgi:hypothetical protein
MAARRILELGGIDREQAAEHHRLRRLEARQRLGRGRVVGDGVADAGVGHFLDRAGEEADLAGAELVDISCIFGVNTPTRSTVGFGVGAHHADGLALLQHAVDDAHQHDDAEIGVVPAVDQQRL